MKFPSRTLAEDLEVENELLRRRFVHATRPKGLLTLNQALELHERMENKMNENQDSDFGGYNNKSKLHNAPIKIEKYDGTLNSYQDAAITTAIYPGQGSFNGLIYTTLKLNGEAGELAEKVGKVELFHKRK